MPLIPGQKLAAYEIIATLGTGGMGEVYRARDARLGRDVALKILPPDVTNEAGRLERFDREARAIAALNHPHIVTIYSTEEEKDLRFMTMELVDGCTLGDLIVPSGMAIAKFLDIAIPLADALAAAHQKQITHRDLKPGNVMVSSDGRVKVLDFGLARVGGSDVGEQTLIETLAPITQQGVIVGTMPYMSPEQIEGRAIDARSDLFSLGVIFYELLAGERPFKGGSSPALMSAILRDTPRSLSERRPDIPEPLTRLVGRLLEKRPDDRWQTARDVFNELRHVQRVIDSGSTPRSTPSASSAVSSAARTGRLTLAVLPIVSRSADETSRSLADAITDDIIASLSLFGHLRVLSRTTVEQLARDRAALSAQARFAVEGQVRASGSQVRVGLTLVELDSGVNLWSANYDRDLAEGIFAVQDAVAGAAVTEIGDQTGALTHAMASAIADIPLHELNAAELIVRYCLYAQNVRADEHGLLREAFERLVAREPRAAEAWACLARLYEHERGFGFNPLPDSLSRQRRAAEQAVEIDSRSQLAWVAMASACSFARDLHGLRAAAERAVAINPLNADLVANTGIFLSVAGDDDRALELIAQASRFKRQTPGWYRFPALNAAINRGDYEVALREVKAVNMPKVPTTHSIIAAVAGHLGKRVEAKAALDALRAMNPALLDPAIMRAYWEETLWREAHVERLVAGFTAALAFGRSDLPSSSGMTASIAVLPFADLSEKRDQDWFCDGIAEEILNALAPLPGLRVAARASAFSFKGKSDDLGTIAQKLNVETVLEGSVRRFGDRVRITTQLSDAREGRQLWSERFDRELKDIFDVQDEIARAIVSRLKITLRAGADRIVQKRTTNMEAYELVLKGRDFVTRRGRAVLDAIALFQRAIELDPDFSEAHALLGDAYRVLGLYGVAPAGEVIPKGQASTRRALEIEPDNAEALATLAIIGTIYEWDLDEMRRRSERALAADPDHVRANVERAISLACIAQPDDSWHAEARRHIDRARKLDPLNAWAMALEGAIVNRMGDVEEAVRITARALEVDANNFAAHWFHVNALAESGRYQETIDAAQPALALSNRHTIILTILSSLYSSGGELDKVEEIRSELRERAKTGYVGHAARAAVAAAAGDWPEARELLGRAIAEHDPYVVFWKLYAWRPVWNDEECAAMIRATSLFNFLRR